MHEVVARALVSEAQAGMPNEVCGFILDEGKTYIPVENCSPEPSRGFQMQPDQMLSLLLEHEHDIIGVYHSHPSGARHPSVDDLPIMKHYEWLRFWIVTCQDVYEWKLVDDRARPCRLDGSPGAEGLVYPVLAPSETLRRQGQ